MRMTKPYVIQRDDGMWWSGCGWSSHPYSATPFDWGDCMYVVAEMMMEGGMTVHMKLKKEIDA